MNHPELLLEISDEFPLKTLFSYSVEDTMRIGQTIADTLTDCSPVMLRRDDTYNILSLLAEPKSGKTKLAHAIANAFTGNLAPDFQSVEMNRDMPAWSIWRQENTYISNTDSILEEWGKCSPPPPPLVPSAFRMVEHAGSEIQLMSAMLISISKTENSEISPRKFDIYINPQCNVAHHLLQQLKI